MPKHSELKKKLVALESLPHLSYEQELEETRLKKIKLRLKDQMEAIVSQYRSQTGRLTSGARLIGRLMPGRLRPAGHFRFMESGTGACSHPHYRCFRFAQRSPAGCARGGGGVSERSASPGFEGTADHPWTRDRGQREIVRGVLARSPLGCGFSRRTGGSRRLGRNPGDAAPGLVPGQLCYNSHVLSTNPLFY